MVLSLGLGLALLVTLALIDGNLRRELTGDMAERAPNFFFVDIQGSEIEGFRSLLAGAMPEGKIIEVPMLRGRIVALNGEDVNSRNVPPGGQWVLRGDRGITYARNRPENSKLTEGSWWPEDYGGEPLVSFSAEEARELGLKLGDTVTVNVLGRNITARIANSARSSGNRCRSISSWSSPRTPSPAPRMPGSRPSSIPTPRPRRRRRC